MLIVEKTRKNKEQHKKISKPSSLGRMALYVTTQVGKNWKNH